MDFNSSICQAMAKSMEHLTDFVFVNMANVTLLRRDSYLAYLKAGIKADTLAALRTAPLHLPTLFPDSVIKQAEEDITSYDKDWSGSVYKNSRYHRYERTESKPDNKKQERLAWKNLSRGHNRRSKGRHQFSWEDLDTCAFLLATILGKVVEKLQDSPCNRIILIAPGWPNMPWFWDLVAMSSQIPLNLPSLPNLLTQPFNQIPHRNLTNLNLHAWLLQPQQSRASLRQWQQELRLLKEDQPDQSMRQSGSFLQSGASPD